MLINLNEELEELQEIAENVESLLEMVNELIATVAEKQYLIENETTL